MKLYRQIKLHLPPLLSSGRRQQQRYLASKFRLRCSQPSAPFSLYPTGLFDTQPDVRAGSNIMSFSSRPRLNDIQHTIQQNVQADLSANSENDTRTYIPGRVKGNEKCIGIVETSYHDVCLALAIGGATSANSKTSEYHLSTPLAERKLSAQVLQQLSNANSSFWSTSSSCSEVTQRHSGMISAVSGTQSFNTPFHMKCWFA